MHGNDVRRPRVRSPSRLPERGPEEKPRTVLASGVGFVSSPACARGWKVSSIPARQPGFRLASIGFVSHAARERADAAGVFGCLRVFSKVPAASRGRRPSGLRNRDCFSAKPCIPVHVELHPVVKERRRAPAQESTRRASGRRRPRCHARRAPAQASTPQRGAGFRRVL